MKTIRILALALGFLVLGNQVAPAQDIAPAADEQTEAPEKKSRKKKKKAKAAAVPAALKKVKRVSGRVNQKALVYIYLQSASWCGPCKKAMPEIVEIYKEMRKDKRAEIVLVGWDNTPEEVKAYIESYRCKMPAVSKDARNVDKLPGFAVADGIPDAIMVDANGNVIKKGYPTYIIPTWKAEVERLEKAAKEAEAAEAEKTEATEE